MKNIFIFALFTSLLFSCSSNDEHSDPALDSTNYSSGFLITNEGNFTSANASISFISNNLSAIENTIYKAANGTSVGDVVQSIAFTNDLAFVVVNNSNVIEVVTKKDFKKVYTISQNIVNPRYAIVKNNLLYVTNSNKSITIYDASSFGFVKKIALNFTPEFIVEANNKVYTSSNFYDSSSVVGIIDINTNELETSLNFDLPINGLTSGDNAIYVLTTSSLKTTIETISNTIVSKTNEYSILDARFLTYDQGNLYFTANLGIYRAKVAELTQNIAASELFKVNDNSWSSLYGFEVFDGNIFTSDAKGFTQDSEITIYNSYGTKVNTFTAGIGTNGFYKI